MSATLNPKRLFSVPERPMSADPASTISSSLRPSFSSFSSFSSSISSVFGGRHSRSSSTSTHNLGAPPLTRPASAAPTQQPAKWVPRPTTPGTASQSRPSRHRATSSASAAAAALSSSAEPPLPPLPRPPEHQRRSSPAPIREGVVDSGVPEPWKVEIQRNLHGKYMHRVRGAQRDYASRLRNVKRSSMGVSKRRDSLSSGSTVSSTESSADEGSMPEELRSRLSQEHEQTLLRVKREYEEELRAVIREEAHRRGVSPHPYPSLHNQTPFDRQEREQDVLVEDDLADEWTWRPEEVRRRPSEGERDRGTDKEKLREMVRQEQQVIWDTIKRGATPANASQQQQQPLSSSAGRKVHFAPSTPPSSDASANSNPPSAAPISATQTQPPSLPRTPHTPVGLGYPVRPISAHPSVSNSTSGATRPLSPAVTAPGVRSSSARPASPAYMRWLPSAGPASSTTAATTGQLQGATRTGSNPIAIPGRNSSAQVVADGNGSAGKDRTGNSMSGSWRDWPASSHGHGGARRDAPTPSPTAGNGSSHVQPYPRTASSSNLHSSMYTTTQMHSRTPSSGNLHAYPANNNPSHLGHARVPSNGNLQSNTGSGMRRAVTPGPMSSASGYARQRTASMNGGPGVGPQRVTSVPPIPALREREKDRDRRRKGVVDDREPDDSPAPANMQPVQRIQATAGLGSRTSSNRSALVDDDAPVPEAFSHVPAPVIHTSSSQRSQRSNSRRSHVVDEDEVIPPPRRDKGKGKARAPPSPLLSTTPLPGSGGRRGTGVGGMYAAQLEDFASLLRKDLGISAEA